MSSSQRREPHTQPSCSVTLRRAHLEEPSHTGYQHSIQNYVQNLQKHLDQPAAPAGNFPQRNSLFCGQEESKKIN